ncbi:hypothetical protein DH2020_019822 [Rehmannia glutinosa]|uniref:Phospholipid/glycerol acyltransferase domain-containing protein n=1 Tax=Rehmannia glutinosa TaxID=99300 RepID=A0ABR0WGJ1_REHGL
MAVPRTANTIPTIYECDSKDRENQTVVADLHGTLLIGRSSFPYFALIAFDVGGILRFLFLLLVAPLAGLLYHFVSESAGIRVLIFATFVRVKVADIKKSLARFCLSITRGRASGDPYLKDYLGVDVVLGTEISSYKGIATGFVASNGVLVGENKAIALRRNFGLSQAWILELGIETLISISWNFACHTKVQYVIVDPMQERYRVPSGPGIRPVRQGALPKPVIFHDGRLVQKPTPLTALLIVLWFPIGLILSILRVFMGSQTPVSLSYHVINLLGCPTTIKGAPPNNVKHSLGKKGVVFVLSHRTVADPVYVSACLGCMTSTITYSTSRFTDFLSPIKMVSLTRDRVKDAKLIEQILNEERYLVMCPEGTTCREPYLLRFSSLFAN